MSADRIDILHAVTSAVSLVLMRGQLDYLRTLGYRTAALCSPGEQVDELRAQDIEVFTVEMQREISPVNDLVSLVRTWRLLRRVRPMVCNAGTRGAGLLVGLAAWANRVPCRVYTLRGLRLETATGLKRTILRATERIACACAHRVLCVSPSLRARAIELNLVGADKAFVLGAGSSNGVNAARFESSDGDVAGRIRRRHGIARSAPVVG